MWSWLCLPTEDEELGSAAGKSHEVNASLEQGANVHCRQGLGARHRASQKH